MTSPDFLESQFGLTGRRALVTGASRGLGLVFAAALAQASANVVLAGRYQEALERAAGTLRQDVAEASHVILDVTDTSSVNVGFKKVGTQDILVNNAGRQHRGPLETFTDEEWNRVMSTNLDGVFRTSRLIQNQDGLVRVILHAAAAGQEL